jgi:hypothetical protein
VRELAADRAKRERLSETSLQLGAEFDIRTTSRWLEDIYAQQIAKWRTVPSQILPAPPLSARERWLLGWRGR